MAMYDKFNRTLGKRARNFYQDNKKLIRNTALLSGLATVIFGYSCHASNKTDKQIEYLMPVWKESVDKPRSENQTFRDNFDKIYYEQNSKK